LFCVLRDFASEAGFDISKVMFYSYLLMRNHLLSIFSILVLCFLPASVRAEGGAAVENVMVVNMQKVIDQSIMGKAARADLQDDLKKREASLGGRRTEVEKLKADLQKQASLLAGAALADRQQAIAKKERDLQQEFEAQRDEMARKTDSQMKKIISQIDAVLSDIVKSKENAIVVEQDPRLVVYSDPKLDITDEVVKRLNDKKMSL
jgi:outer membrane protein